MHKIGVAIISHMDKLHCQQACPCVSVHGRHDVQHTLQPGSTISSVSSVEVFCVSRGGTVARAPGCSATEWKAVQLDFVEIRKEKKKKRIVGFGISKAGSLTWMDAVHDMTYKTLANLVGLPKNKSLLGLSLGRDQSRHASTVKCRAVRPQAGFRCGQDY